MAAAERSVQSSSISCCILMQRLVHMPMALLRPRVPYMCMHARRMSERQWLQQLLPIHRHPCLQTWHSGCLLPPAQRVSRPML